MCHNNNNNYDIILNNHHPILTGTVITNTTTIIVTYTINIPLAITITNHISIHGYILDSTHRFMLESIRPNVFKTHFFISILKFNTVK